VGAVLCQVGYGVVTSVVSWDQRCGLRGEERVETYMPEFPPVTMNTLPLRSGRVSGWKVMFKMSTVLESMFEGVIALLRNRYSIPWIEFHVYDAKRCAENSGVATIFILLLLNNTGDTCY
jgi:hypothetical protein